MSSVPTVGHPANVSATCRIDGQTYAYLERRAVAELAAQLGYYPASLLPEDNRTSTVG